MTSDANVRRRGLRELVRWQGLMYDSSPASRKAGIGALAIAAVAMVATQLNYIVVGHAHMIAVLAPIAACALLYGPVVALLTGALTGLAELIHATLLPLDYYEKYFMVPWNSVLLFGLVGLILGIAFAFAEQWRGKAGWRRPVWLVIYCALTSLFFTGYFQLSNSIINAVLAFELPRGLLTQLTGSRESILQFVTDALLMAGMTLVADKVNDRRESKGSVLTIRETFQGWLAVVMSLAYMICASLAYTGISIACRGDAELEMTSQLQYLENQLQERDKIMEGFARRTSASQRVIDEVHESSIGSVARGFALGEKGVSVIAEDGLIVSSNRESYLGREFSDVVGSGLRDGFDEALYDAPRSSEWDMGGGVLGYERIAQIGYVRVAKSGNYQLMVAMAASDVFYYRQYLMIVVSLVFMGIFVVVYVQAAYLLRNVVVRGFDATNATLARITDGDLEQVVDVHDTVEFTALSGGINATVGALRESIAEATARIDRELRTAKAIQESALPRTFPPFPDIDRFDIYARMDPAREVGGDFYDFFLVDDHTLGFLIADVSGKGIPAALFMMAAKTEVYNYMTSGIDLSQAIQSANYHLCQGNESGMFVTLWAATLDWKTGELTYVNAGHNPPLLRHEGSWQWLRERGGVFLGSFDIAKYRSQTIVLHEGDQLLLYTDGVTEAFSVDIQQYGEIRLENFLAEHKGDHPHALVDAVRDDVARWAAGAEQSDDITMLSIEFGVAPEASGSITVPATLDHLDDIIDMVHVELAKRLCPIEVQNQIDIALEELFVNVCNYAYEGADEPGLCRVDYVYNANPDAIIIQLTDEGVPFDPLEHADPERPRSAFEASIGGLGIMMARRLTDDMTYLRDGNSNVVAFKKRW